MGFNDVIRTTAKVANSGDCSVCAGFNSESYRFRSGDKYSVRSSI